jgi:hypothetical protein
MLGHAEQHGDPIQVLSYAFDDLTNHINRVINSTGAAVAPALLVDIGKIFTKITAG